VSGKWDVDESRTLRTADVGIRCMLVGDVNLLVEVLAVEEI